jgi:hypothetical protein
MACNLECVELERVPVDRRSRVAEVCRYYNEAFPDTDACAAEYCGGDMVSLNHLVLEILEQEGADNASSQN